MTLATGRRITAPRSTDWPPATALVLGATGGIGGAFAHRLARGGTDVLAAGRDVAALARLADAGCRTWAGSLTGGGAVEVGRYAGEALGSLELLVACAGIGAAGQFLDQPPELISDVIDTDLTAAILAVHAALPDLMRGGGRVLLVGSVSGSLAPRGEAVYAAAKAGLAAFASALRSELAPSGVSVTLLVPAVVDTAFFDRRGRPAPRSAPAARPPREVAARALEAARQRRAEVWTPGWLRYVARFAGLAPGPYHRLADALVAGA